MLHGSAGMLGTMMTFQDGTDYEKNKVLDFLFLRKIQEAHEHIVPTPRLGGISFINVITMVCKTRKVHEKSTIITIVIIIIIK